MLCSGDWRLIWLQQEVAELRLAVGPLKEAEVKVRDGAAGLPNTDLSRTFRLSELKNK